MKTIKILMLATIPFLFSSYTIRETNTVKNVRPQTTVYVCNGPSATRYHSTKSCTGLSNCSASITSHTEKEAIAKGRSKCSRCW